MKQEELEKEVEHLENTIAALHSKLEKKQNQLDKNREYVDTLILADYNQGELQQYLKLTEKQTDQMYEDITDMYVRYWFKDRKIEIIKKDDQNAKNNSS